MFIEKRDFDNDCSMEIRIYRYSYAKIRWAVTCLRGEEHGYCDTYYDACVKAGESAEGFIELQRESRWTVTEPGVKKGGGA